MWNITKTVKKGDYLYAVVKEHPKATKYGYVLCHRVVMENKLGRLLKSDEIVHHIDENKFNNSPDNLEVMTNSEHIKHHQKDKKPNMVHLLCPECNNNFSKPKRLALNAIKKNIFCSRQCNGKYQRKRTWKEKKNVNNSNSTT